MRRRQLTVDQVAARLERQTMRRNKRFDKAKPPQKRVMIAQDVLEQLRLRKYEATHGTYFALRTDKLDIDAADLSTVDTTVFFDGEDLRQTRHRMRVARRVAKLDMSAAINTLGCEVCAIGAAFASCVRLDDRLKIGKAQDGGSSVFGELTDNGVMAKKVRRFFPDKLLDEMESAFEQGFHGYGNVPRGAARLRAIFRNLIAHKGERFTVYKTDKDVWPEQEPVKVTRTPAPRPFPEPWLMPPVSRGPDLAESLAGDDPQDL